MNAIEKVRKIRENKIGMNMYGFYVDFALPESEAAEFLTDEPSTTAEELGRKMAEEAYEGCEEYFTALIQSALTAHSKAKVEEAADRFCTICPERDVADDGTFVCESDWNGVCCPKLAAILGNEG